MVFGEGVFEVVMSSLFEFVSVLDSSGIVVIDEFIVFDVIDLIG